MPKKIPLQLAEYPDSTVARVPIPKTRDPFVNTPLLRVKCDEQGVEWFWISSWNSISGTQGVLVSEYGDYRIYRFPPHHGGFYSAVVEDADTLWLCGSLDRVVRLTLSSGKTETFATGAPAALVFQGMAYDPLTGKLFAAAFPPPTTAAFSFDTRRRETARLYADFTPAHYMRCSFPNGDGTYSIMLECPDNDMLCWDPQAETLESAGLPVCDMRLLQDERGHYYFPGQGWYNPATRTIAVGGPRPAKEMSWFGRHDELAFGAPSSGFEARVTQWNMAGGEMLELCPIPDCHVLGINVTEAGKLIAVNIYGVFYRFDGHDGTLEMSRVLPTAALGVVDCLCRLDRKRLLGTTFITQRFWEVNLATGAGFDCGRAAPGGGEILRTWKIGGKVYLAAYGGGELLEYDPAVHPHFPENPRVVADPPGGMRPVANADDGRRLYYACNAEYGHLGSVLTSYDTKTGKTRYAPNPLPAQAILSLGYDKKHRALLAGTTFRADCQSCPPATDRCYFARLDPDTLAVEQSFPAPDGSVAASIGGPLGGGKWLAYCSNEEWWLSNPQWFALEITQFAPPAPDSLRQFPTGLRQLIYAGKPGKFVCWIADRIELWDMRKNRCLALLASCFDGYRIVVQEKSLYLINREEIVVIDDFMKEWGV